MTDLQKNLITIVVSLLIVGWGIWLFKKNTNNSKVEYKYKTDTVFIDTSLTVPPIKGKFTPPRIYTNYVTDTLRLSEVKVKTHPDSLVVLVQSLKDTIEIYKDFLKKFPRLGKLVFMKLQQDSLQMGLVNITGKTYQLDYPINLTHYDYFFYNDTLTRSKINSNTPSTTSPFFDLYAKGSYDVFLNSPTLGVEGIYKRKRLSFFMDIGLPLSKLRYSQAKVGVRFKINGMYGQ